MSPCWLCYALKPPNYGKISRSQWATVSPLSPRLSPPLPPRLLGEVEGCGVGLGGANGESHPDLSFLMPGISRRL